MIVIPPSSPMPISHHGPRWRASAPSASAQRKLAPRRFSRQVRQVPAGRRDMPCPFEDAAHGRRRVFRPHDVAGIPIVRWTDAKHRTDHGRRAYEIPPLDLATQPHYISRATGPEPSRPRYRFASLRAITLIGFPEVAGEKLFMINILVRFAAANTVNRLYAGLRSSHSAMP